MTTCTRWAKAGAGHSPRCDQKRDQAQTWGSQDLLEAVPRGARHGLTVNPSIGDIWVRGLGTDTGAALLHALSALAPAGLSISASHPPAPLAKPSLLGASRKKRKTTRAKKVPNMQEQLHTTADIV